MPETVSYSEIDTYRQCALKHQLSYMERWRKTGDEAEPLVRGTLFHSVMEAHYGALLKWQQEPVGTPVPEAQDLFLAVAPFLYEEGTGEQSDRQELVEWIYRGYVEHYQADYDWEIVAIEHPIEFPMFNRHGEVSDIVLKGTVDLIVKDHSAGGGLWIVDHKTCKNLPKQKDFDMEDQTGIYTFLMKRNGFDIRGAIYNHCRTERLKTREMGMDERFKRTLTVRSDDELFRMVAEAEEQIQEAYQRDLGVDTPEVRDAPRTPDGERCGWKCGYTEPCLAGRKMGPMKTRQFLRQVEFAQHETKPGPTFNKKVLI
jgi:hypothetical protein